MLVMTEAELQANVLELARLLKWRCYHTFDSRRSEPGFPDLVMLRGERIIVAELKSERGRLTTEQDAWLDAFRAALAGADVTIAVWKPRDWLNGAIEDDLR